MFYTFCDSAHEGRVWTIACWDSPRDQAPPRTRHSPRTKYPPWDQAPQAPGPDTPSSRTRHPLGPGNPWDQALPRTRHPPGPGTPLGLGPPGLCTPWTRHPHPQDQAILGPGTPVTRHPSGTKYPPRTRHPHIWDQAPPRTRNHPGPGTPGTRLPIPLGPGPPGADTSPWHQVPAPSPPSRNPPPAQCMLGDTGNKRAVRILLECKRNEILVVFIDNTSTSVAWSSLGAAILRKAILL